MAVQLFGGVEILRLLYKKQNSGPEIQLNVFSHTAYTVPQVLGFVSVDYSVLHPYVSYSLYVWRNKHGLPIILVDLMTLQAQGLNGAAPYDH